MPDAPTKATAMTACNNMDAASWRSREDQGQIPVIDAIFGRCRGDSIIATGIERPCRTSPDPAPCYYQPFTVRDRVEMIPYLFDFLWNHTKYICFNTLDERALQGRSFDLFRRNNAGMDAKKYTYFGKTNDNVRELVAITLDLDSYKRDISAEIALGLVLHRCQTDDLPLPSLFARSGRGAYLLWLLQSLDGRPPMNTPDNRALYGAIVENLLQRFENLEADPHSRVLSQYYKSPGTTDSKTGRRVYYAVFGGGSLAQVHRYSLEQLTGALGIRAGAPAVLDDDVRHLIPKELKLHRSAPGRGGERHRTCIAEIEQISIARGGMRPGCRAMALFFYYQACYAYLKTVARAGLADRAAIADADRRCRQDAQRATDRLNSTFDPPLPEREVTKACGKGFSFPKGARRGYPRRATIAGYLHVTPAEAARLGLKHLLPASMIDEQTEMTNRGRALRRARHEAVDRELMRGKTSPTKIARLVANELGVSCSRQFVAARKALMEKKGLLPSGEPVRSLFSGTITNAQAS